MSSIAGIAPTPVLSELFMSRDESLLLTVVYIQDEQILPLSRWVDDVQVELFGVLLDFTDVALVILICDGSGRVGGEVDVKVV